MMDHVWVVDDVCRVAAIWEDQGWSSRKCRVHDSLRGYFHQSYQDSSSEEVIDGANSTISEEDSNLDEKNKRHTSSVVPLSVLLRCSDWMERSEMKEELPGTPTTGVSGVYAVYTCL